MEGGVWQWHGINRTVKKSGEEKTGVTTLRAVDGRLASSGKEEGELLAGHYRRVETPGQMLRLMRYSRKEVDDWVKGEDVTSKESSGTEELQRDFAVDKIENYITKLQTDKAVGSDEIVNEFMKPARKWMVETMGDNSRCAHCFFE